MKQSIQDIPMSNNDNKDEFEDKGKLKSKQSNAGINIQNSTNSPIHSRKFKNSTLGYSLFSCLTSNYGINEASTQTDLTVADLSRIDDVFLAHKSYINQLELSKKSPFNDIYQINSSLFKNIKDEKSLKKPPIKHIHLTTSDNSHPDKRKYKKKTYKDIKIYNSVVVNNNDTDIGKQYSQRLFDFFASAKLNQQNEKDSEESLSDIEINQMLNQMRGKEEKKSSLQLKNTQKNEEDSVNNDKEEILNPDLSSKLDSESSELSQDKAKPVNQAKRRGPKPHLHLRRKRKSSKKDNISSSQEYNKEKVSKSVINEKVISSKLEENCILSSNLLKFQKRKYDPFNFFLDEFRQHNSENTKEMDVEREAKEQWLKLDKETKKIYNMHADREKKLQKQKKRQNKSNKLLQEEAAENIENLDQLENDEENQSESKLKLKEEDIEEEIN